MFIRWSFSFHIIKQMWMCSLNFISNEDKLGCPFCGTPLYRSLTRNTRERPSTANILWHMNMAAHVLLLAGDTCSCWLGTRGWRVWAYTCLARLTELGRWIMLAESPSASRRKKWRKNSFLFCRIFRSDYPINVWKLVTAADYRDNQGKCSNIRKLIHEHEENLICFMFNLIHSLTIQYNTIQLTVLKWCHSPSK